MEQWVPLLHIFLHSPTPEMEASLWLQQSFSSRITTSSFISLLSKPSNAVVVDYCSPASSSPRLTKRVMFMHTLPNMVQSRILYFLAFEHQRFCARDLCKLARDVLSGEERLDFWVKRAARNLLDAVSDSNYDWISRFGLDSGEERVEEEFDSVPAWLTNAMDGTDMVLPWLPISAEDLNASSSLCTVQHDSDFMSQIVEDGRGEDGNQMVEDIEIDPPTNLPLEPDVREMAMSLRCRIVNLESTSETVNLASEISQLCLEKGKYSFSVLGVLEPWNVDDETASILLSHLSSGNEQELTWQSQVLSSIILPKLLILSEPASRVLVTATIKYCKHHQKATVDALLLPLILRKEGINTPICDIITRIIRECLHPAHVSAFCQKLLCGGKDDRRYICHPCHEHLVSAELVWTESLCILFQNILNHNVHLTQDLVDHLAYKVQELAVKFSKSLKFGNFMLCLVTKFLPLLKCHKHLLTEAAGNTNTLVTKSILSKLASL